jgi:glycosyltransferase involved in cell wall biosynthesis
MISSRAPARPVKILYVVDHFFSGGTQRNIKDFMELCDPSICDVRIFSLFGGDAYFSPSDQNRHRKICLLRRRFSLLWYSLTFPYIVFKLRQYILSEGIQAVHLRLYAALPAGVTACKLARVRHILYTIEASRKQLPIYCFPLFRLFAPAIQHFFSYYKKEYLAASLPKSKFHFYRGGINLDKVHHSMAKRSETLERLGFADAYPILLSVGRLHPHKGHQYIISALPHLTSRFPRIKLIILGEGDFRPQLEEHVAVLNLEEHVCLAGFHNDINDFHAIAHLFVKAAVNEPTNLATLLALAHGNPVVSFDTGFEEEILKHMKTGFFVPNRDSVALAEGIAAVLGNPELRAALSERGRRLVFESHNILHSIRWYEKFYAGLCHDNQALRAQP